MGLKIKELYFGDQYEEFIKNDISNGIKSLSLTRLLGGAIRGPIP